MTSRVAAADRREYLDTIASLKQHHSARGINLWLFEQADQPGSFIEFSESATGAGQRGATAPGDAESSLEDRLAELAQHSSGHGQQWLEVELPTVAEGGQDVTSTH